MAYTRLQNDERRRRLLTAGRELFTAHAYDELTMGVIAAEAGISRGLLYHYFPSKQAFFVATLQEAAAEVAARVLPDPAEPPARQLDHAVAAWVDWVDANRDAYAKLIRSSGAITEVRELVERVRSDTAEAIAARLWPGQDAPPELGVAARAWLAVMDQVCLDWVERGDLDRAAVAALVRGALPGLIDAAGQPAIAAVLR